MSLSQGLSPKTKPDKELQDGLLRSPTLNIGPKINKQAQWKPNQLHSQPSDHEPAVGVNDMVHYYLPAKGKDVEE